MIILSGLSASAAFCFIDSLDLLVVLHYLHVLFHFGCQLRFGLFDSLYDQFLVLHQVEVHFGVGLDAGHLAV